MAEKVVEHAREPRWKFPVRTKDGQQTPERLRAGVRIKGRKSGNIHVWVSRKRPYNAVPKCSFCKLALQHREPHVLREKKEVLFLGIHLSVSSACERQASAAAAVLEGELICGSHDV
jgi:hypothetical protein